MFLDTWPEDIGCVPPGAHSPSLGSLGLWDTLSIKTGSDQICVFFFFMLSFTSKDLGFNKSLTQELDV